MIELGTISDNTEYHLATPEERMRSMFKGDPVADYFGYPEIQLQILADERQAVADEATSDEVPGAIGTLLLREAFPERETQYHYRIAS